MTKKTFDGKTTFEKAKTLLLCFEASENRRVNGYEEEKKSIL